MAHSNEAPWKGDKSVIFGAVLGALVLAASIWAWYEPGKAATVVYALTAIAVIWYSVLTNFIRRSADEERRHRSTPVLGFAIACVRSEDPDLDVRFIVKNNTGRLAVIRPTIRLRSWQGFHTFENGVYAGSEDWEIWAFDEWSGHFPLAQMVPGLRAPDGYNPRAGMQWPISLDVQVVVYNSNGEFQYLFRREYHVEIVEDMRFGKSWPEIAIDAFPDCAPYPARITRRATIGSSASL
ncbi:MAG: hypothetical protein LAO51_07095 [Acidobacteriia bacterium]|nr:hypothetical protein [Terriglobia bacterium]